MPACAALFVRGDVARARRTVTAGIAPDVERRKLHETLSAWTLTADNLGLDPRLSLLHAAAMDLEASETPDPPTIAEDASTFVSDTGQLRWDVSQPGGGYFIANTPRTKLFTGFVRDRTFRLGELTLRIGPTRLDWATVSMVCIDGDGFDRPGRILVAAIGWVQNQDAELRELGGNRVTLGNQWGNEPVLCEGVPAEITFPVAPGRVQLYPLDESGSRREKIPTDQADDKVVAALAPEHKTVWYEVQIQ